MDHHARQSRRRSVRAFTLIELLVVISIISLLISILMPSLSRARDQAKSIHCLARLKEYGTALATYTNANDSLFPPARWFPNENDLGFGPNDPAVIDPDRPVEFGWAELLYTYVYKDEVRIPKPYPVLRSADNRQWEKYFMCQAVGDIGENSGHYRVYLPAWAAGTYALEANRVYGDSTRANPDRGSAIEKVRLRLPIIGDANEASERGDGKGDDDCSYIDAGEANFAGSDGRRNGNRFSDRHYGGTNYLYPDMHAAWNTKLREQLARDYDLNGVLDIAAEE